MPLRRGCGPGACVLCSHHRGTTKCQYWTSRTDLGGWSDTQNGCIGSPTRYYLDHRPLFSVSPFIPFSTPTCDRGIPSPSPTSTTARHTTLCHGHSTTTQPPPPRARTHRRDRRALEIRDKAGFPPAATQPENGLTSLEKPTRHSQQNKTLESSLVEEAATVLHFLAIFQIKNHTPPPTMISSTLLCIASALLASAHTVITYPGWRGNNLLTNTDFPYGMQWAYPCKSPPRRLPPLPSLTTPSRRRHPLDNEPDVLASNRRRGRLPTRMVPGPLDRLHLRQHGSRD